MSNMLETMIADDFLWSAIQTHISAKIRRTSTHFITLNCPVCHLYGESPDTRKRCGIKRNSDGVGINCFNCGFKTRYVLGKIIPKKMGKFLEAIGVSEREIGQLNLKAMQYRRMIGANEDSQNAIGIQFVPNYPTVSLPDGARSFEELAEEGCSDEDFLSVADYLLSRGNDIAESTTYYWTPNTDNKMNRRVIIPFYFHNNIIIAKN